MHRFARVTNKQVVKVENEAREEPKAKKTRLANKISTIATLDSGTMVEAFKYLNYCQLAKKSLVSMRFRNVIQTHRHKLAVLYVDSIRMERTWRVEHTVIKRFNKELSPEQYKHWVVRNKYSKHTSLKISTAVNCELSAYGDYKDRNPIRTPVFFARVKEINDETWPLFQHFVRLLTDPFICLRYLSLITQADVFNLLAVIFNRSNRGRLQCEILSLKFEGNVQNPLNWIKDHVRCGSFQQSIPVSNCSPVRRKQYIDFFITGSHCTSEIIVTDSNISKDVIIDFVQKFTHLKNCDEIHIVNSIRGKVFYMSADALDTIYEQFIIKNDKNRKTTAQVFEFVNVVIRKKLQLSITSMSYHEPRPIIMEIINL